MHTAPWHSESCSAAQALAAMLSLEPVFSETSAVRGPYSLRRHSRTHYSFLAPEQRSGLLACSAYPCWRAFEAPALNLSLNIMTPSSCARAAAVLRLEPVFSDTSAVRGPHSLRRHSRTHSRHQSSGAGF